MAAVAGDEPASHPSSEQHDGPHATLPAPKGYNGPSTKHNGFEAFATVTSKSNMFKLQVDEMLAEVTPQYEDRMGPTEDALRAIKSLIEDLPEVEGLTIVEAERDLQKSHKIAIPFPSPRPSKDTNYKFAYAKPSNINVVGGYALKTVIDSQDPILIDLAVTMPAGLFQEKDYLNYRYFHKRAYYLARIAAGLQGAPKTNFSVHFALLNDNHLQPTIIVNLSKGHEKNSSSSPVAIQILLAIPEDAFSKSKTLPDRNCVRSNKLVNGLSSPESTPTPTYNASLRAESSIASYLKVLFEASTVCRSYKDACILGRIWLRQRGFGSGIARGGFGPFEWAALTALLLQGGGPKGQRLLSPGYSSYQLFKSMLQFLSTRDLTKKPLVFRTMESDIATTDSPTFFDGVRGMNLLYKMSPWSYTMVRHESFTTLQMLNDTIFDNFEASFIAKVDDPLQKFDIVMRIPLMEAILKVLQPSNHESKQALVSKMLYQILHRALGDRVDLIDISCPEVGSWTTKNTMPNLSKEAAILVKLILNPANSERTVDHGPPAEDKREAAEFRQFWGPKAELRRFQDGGILESLVWAGDKSSPPIVHQIIVHILNRHTSPEVTKSVEFVGGEIDHLLPDNPRGSSRTVDLYQPWIASFNKLEKLLRDLEGLPLQLRQLSTASPLLRYSKIDVPNSDSSPTSIDPADIVLHFEGSGRWPDDLTAIQRTKIALLLKISELISKSDPSLTTRLGLENQTNNILNNAFLDIVSPNMTAFRLRIHAERERTLLERRLKDKTLPNSSHQDTAVALSTYKRTFIHAPSHTQAIRTLCTRFPLLSSTLRLVHLWFASHLLTPHIPLEVIDLLTIRNFTSPYPWAPPSSSRAGFLRTLYFLSRWDWRSDPLIVPCSTSDITLQSLESIRTTFAAWRKIDPAMQRVALFVASPTDPSGTVWTQYARPPKVLAARMTSLAKAACAAVREAGLDLQPEALFTSPTTHYSFLIHLTPAYHPPNRGLAPTTTLSPERVYKNLQPSHQDTSTDTTMIGYDPVRLFLDDLESLYSPHILFLHNPHAGTFIAGLWTPHACTPRGWRVGLGYSSVPVSTHGGDGAGVVETDGEGDADAQVVLNKRAVLNEIARLGGDMVARVEVVGGWD
ncbi:MAG: hypothetical protein M1833_005079 [Piccolia ochrophora]|nr:MAG: hypothetical protein M1833_005079 [Piccolia ochrophora]